MMSLFLCLVILGSVSGQFYSDKLREAAQKLAKGVVNKVPDYKKVISDEVSRYSNGRNMCDQNTCCTVSSDEKCGLDKMTPDETTLVLPGGESRCIFSDSSPFAFQVIPGDSDKLLFYFQGGGACWDKLSTSIIPFCTTDASPSSLNGVFSRDNQANKFKDYTIVQVLYCSGDVHGGNVTRPYNDRKGEPVVQVGYQNARSTLNWVLAQQASGALASELSQLVVMGCSAGSIGSQLWSKEVITSIPAKSAAVIPDSYAGVFPEDAEGPLIEDFGFCETPLLDPSLEVKCKNGELLIQDINQANMKSMDASIPFAFINSKRDIVQMSFYWAIAVTTNTSTWPDYLGASEYYNGVNTIFELYNKYPQFSTYLVDGDQHCYTNMDIYYEANPTSYNGKKPSHQIAMSDWVNDVVDSQQGTDVDSVCAGRKAPSDPDTEPTYCDNAMF
jgi:hypothetical protein